MQAGGCEDGLWTEVPAAVQVRGLIARARAGATVLGKVDRGELRAGSLS